MLTGCARGGYRLAGVGVALCLLAGCRTAEPRKRLLTISNARVVYTGERSFQVFVDYEQREAGDLPYHELMIFPLLPLNLGAAVERPVLSVGSWAVSIEVPEGADFEWRKLERDPTCCRMVVKGVKKDPTTGAAAYEIISNEVQVQPAAGGAAAATFSKGYPASPGSDKLDRVSGSHLP